MFSSRTLETRLPIAVRRDIVAKVRPQATDPSQGKQLRICVCVSLFRPSLGGAERQAERLALALVACGHCVTVVTQRLPGTAAEEQLDGVRIVRAIRTWNRGPLYGLTYMLSLAWYLLRHRRSFDLIQATYLYLDAFTALALRPLHRKPVVLRPACGGVDGDLSRLPTLRFCPLWPRLDRPIHTLILRTLRQADAVIALSSELADELRTAGFPPTRIIRIPNGVDARRFAPADGGARRLQQAILGTAGPVLTFVGRLHAQKNLTSLLHAAARLRASWPGLHVVIVGEGPEDKPLRRLARELVLTEQVTFAGGMADVTPFLRATDVFVHLSRAEGMPGALLEAMAAGLPCVATRIGGTVDIIADGVDGLLVEPGDIEAATIAIARCLANPQLGARLGATARQRVEAEFTMEAIAARYVTLYEQLIAE